MPPFPANDALCKHYPGFIALLPSCRDPELLVWEGQWISSCGDHTHWDVPGVLPALQADGAMPGHLRSACTGRGRGTSEKTGLAGA